ncbi:MAG: radical SAM protein [Proteobacteria bacterium]|nr:radical SAM protein [Pseudomonadota bacterium]
MKICLIKPYSSRKRDYEQSHLDVGLAFLARSLQSQGHQVEILDCMRRGMDSKAFSSWLKKSPFDVYCLKIYTHGLPEARTQMRAIKEQFREAWVLVGGPHPSGVGEKVFQHLPGADFAFRGEAEIGLPKLLEVVGSLGGKVVRGENIPATQQPSHPATMLSEIPGLIYRTDGGVKITPSQFVNDLDSIGLPALELINIPGYLKENRRLVKTQYLPVLTSRGCPYPCSYCAASLVSGKKIRRHSVGFLMEWIERYRKDYGAVNFAIIDDAFSEDRGYVMEFCEALLKKNLKMKWDCGTNAVRLDTMEPELLHLMERAGCFYISLGIESGSERILRDMRRKADLAEIREKIRRVKRETRMTVGGFFILGYPRETLDDLRKTIRLALDLPLDLAQFWIFSPYPGTEITKELEQEGRLENLDYTSCHNFAGSLPADGVSLKTIKNYQRYAYVRFYSRPRILASTVKENIRSPRDLVSMVNYLFR